MSKWKNVLALAFAAVDVAEVPVLRRLFVKRGFDKGALLWVEKEEKGREERKPTTQYSPTPAPYLRPGSHRSCWSGRNTSLILGLFAKVSKNKNKKEATLGWSTEIALGARGAGRGDARAQGFDFWVVGAVDDDPGAAEGGDVEDFGDGDCVTWFLCCVAVVSVQFFLSLLYVFFFFLCIGG